MCNGTRTFQNIERRRIAPGEMGKLHTAGLNRYFPVGTRPSGSLFALNTVAVLGDLSYRNSCALITK